MKTPTTLVFAILFLWEGFSDAYELPICDCVCSSKAKTATSASLEARSCDDIKRFDSTSTSDYYTILTGSGDKMELYCEFYGDHGFTYIDPRLLSSVNVQELLLDTAFRIKFVSIDGSSSNIISLSSNEQTPWKIVKNGYPKEYTIESPVLPSEPYLFIGLVPYANNSNDGYMIADGTTDWAPPLEQQCSSNYMILAPKSTVTSTSVISGPTSGWFNDLSQSGSTMDISFAKQTISESLCPEAMVAEGVAIGFEFLYSTENSRCSTDLLPDVTNHANLKPISLLASYTLGQTVTYECETGFVFDTGRPFALTCDVIGWNYNGESWTESSVVPACISQARRKRSVQNAPVTNNIYEGILVNTDLSTSTCKCIIETGITVSATLTDIPDSTADPTGYATFVNTAETRINNDVKIHPTYGVELLEVAVVETTPGEEVEFVLKFAEIPESEKDDLMLQVETIIRNIITDGTPKQLFGYDIVGDLSFGTTTGLGSEFIAKLEFDYAVPASPPGFDISTCIDMMTSYLSCSSDKLKTEFASISIESDVADANDASLHHVVAFVKFASMPQNVYNLPAEIKTAIADNVQCPEINSESLQVGVQAGQIIIEEPPTTTPAPEEPEEPVPELPTFAETWAFTYQLDNDYFDYIEAYGIKSSPEFKNFSAELEPQVNQHIEDCMDETTLDPTGQKTIKLENFDSSKLYAIKSDGTVVINLRFTKPLAESGGMEALQLCLESAINQGSIFGQIIEEDSVSIDKVEYVQAEYIDKMDFFLKVTVPALSVMIFIVILVMCCMAPGSVCCKICQEEDPKKKLSSP